MGPAILAKAQLVYRYYGHRVFVRVVLGRLKLQTKQHHFWGAALLVIFLVSCGSNTPKEEQKPEEQKQSILSAPKPEAPALKKAELGPQPDIGSEIILEVPGEGAQSFHLIGEPGTRYLARVTPLYANSRKTSKKKKRVSAPVATAEQTQADGQAAQEPPKPPQGFTATFFPVAESPIRPGNFYTAETLKGLQEGRYELPSPALTGTTPEKTGEPEKTEKTDAREATEAAQATETVPPTTAPSDPNSPAPSTPPTPLPESLWSSVTNKGTEVFDVETEAVPSDQSAQPVVLEIKNLDAVPRTVKVVIRQRKP